MSATATFSVAPTEEPASELAAKAGRVKAGRDITWSNVDFMVGEKAVLKDCWGEVSHLHCVPSCH